MAESESNTNEDQLQDLQNVVPIDYFGPQPGWQLLDFQEMWRYRELGLVLALRDFKVRYRQAFIGAAWAIVQPVCTLLVFQVLFSLLNKTPTSGAAPYAASALCGLIPWYLFATTVRDASESLVSNRHIITKIYFPRLWLPVGTALVALVDFAIGLVVLFGVLFFFGYTPQLRWLFLIPFTLLAVGVSLSIGIWLSAVNAIYRDVKYIIPFAIQMGFFISPVIYESSSIIPESWQVIHAFNPMVGVIEGFRWALLGGPAPKASVLVVTVISTLFVFAGGLLFFRRAEQKVADRI